MKIGVLLSGSGVYDGTEIHEAVFTLLALDKMGVETFCIAPDIEQHHVINHLTGDVMPEKRNVLIESARIARGNVKPLQEVKASDMDALAIPGGFGAAKNHTKWAFSGADGTIDSDVRRIIHEMVDLEKPIGAMCMSPTTLVKALEGSGKKLKVTVGNTEEKSPYDINTISQGMESLGAEVEMCKKGELIFDDAHNIVTSPCYMMEASITEVYKEIEKTMAMLVEMVTLTNESEGI
jgi:enhancing lycopene biosynthesis protein 2